MSMSGCSAMPLPLAVTMGEPAGIGGEITLKAWLRRGDGLPAFYALDDPDRLAELARRHSWAVPLRAIDEPEAAPAIFPHALPVVSVGATPQGRAGRPEVADAKLVL